jgi:hypothetical protein
VNPRQRVAELEVEVARAHRERGEAARVVDALRAERDGLMGKVLEAARIQGAAAHGGPDFDLAGFISELRSEAIALRSGAEAPAAPDPSSSWMAAPRGPPEARPAPAVEVRAAAPVAAPAAARALGGAPAAPAPAAVGAVATSSAPEVTAPATREAERLLQQGRLTLPASPASPRRASSASRFASSPAPTPLPASVLPSGSARWGSVPPPRRWRCPSTPSEIRRC